MNRCLLARLTLAVCCGTLLAACGGADDVAAGDGEAVHKKPSLAGVETQKSPGKPSPPIRLDYEILGEPVIGIPLSINIQVSSPIDRPITVSYAINDATGLAFSDAQARNVALAPLGDDSFPVEQVVVIPQREGRLYLNVAAEIDTEGGRMSQVMAVPIQVGSLRPVPQVNGELTQGEDGEALISLPAKEE